MLEHNTDRVYFLIGAIVIASIILSSVVYINRDVLFAPVEYNADTEEYEGGKVTAMLQSLVGSGPPPIAEADEGPEISDGNGGGSESEGPGESEVPETPVDPDPEPEPEPEPEPGFEMGFDVAHANTLPDVALPASVLYGSTREVLTPDGGYVLNGRQAGEALLYPGNAPMTTRYYQMTDNKLLSAAVKRQPYDTFEMEVAMVIKPDAGIAVYKGARVVNVVTGETVDADIGVTESRRTGEVTQTITAGVPVSEVTHARGEAFMLEIQTVPLKSGRITISQMYRISGNGHTDKQNFGAGIEQTLYIQ